MRPSLRNALLALTTLTTACSDARAGANEATARGPVADAPLAEFQTELLDLAMETASMLPLFPHVKNRSRAQEVVVDACFELDQPLRALRYAGEIANWRRGMAFANFAHHCIERGTTAEIEEHLERAVRVAEAAETPHDEVEPGQAWRVERVRERVAQGRAELARVRAGRTTDLDDEAFASQLAAFDAVLSAGGFDEAQGTLLSCAELFDRSYADAERRDRLEEQILAGMAELPILVRIDIIAELVESALAHGDHAKALELVEDAWEIVGVVRWTAEYKIPTVARLAVLRHRAGEEERAREELDSTLELFASEGETIATTFRADALRPVPEAYQALGDTAAALEAYRLVVQQGCVSPNSWPRVMDLSATLASMARAGVEPDQALWKRIREIHDGLGPPF